MTDRGVRWIDKTFLGSRLAAAEAALEENQRKISELQNTLHEEKRAAENALTELQAALKAETKAHEALQTTAETQRNKIAQLIERRNSLKQSLLQAKALLAEVKVEAASASAELTSRLQLLGSQHDASLLRAQQLEQALKEAESRNEIERLRIASAEASYKLLLDTLQRERAEADTVREGLEAALKREREESRAATAAAEEASAAVKRLQEDLLLAQREQQVLQAAKAEIESVRLHLAGELEVERARLATSDAENARLSDELRIQIARAEELDAAHRRAVASLEQQRARGDESEASQHRLIQVLEADRSRLTELERDVRNLTSTVDAERERYALGEEQRRQLKDSVTKHKAISETLRVTLDAERERTSKLTESLVAERTAAEALHEKWRETAPSIQRVAAAAAVERMHAAMARSLDLVQPRESAPVGENFPQGFVDALVAQAASQGGLAFSRRGTAASSVTEARALREAVATRRPNWVLLADEDEESRKIVKSVDPSLPVLSLAEAALRLELSLPLDPSKALPNPPNEPKRVLMIASLDRRSATAIAAMIAKLSAVKFAPPAPLAVTGAHDPRSLSKWLRAAWGAVGAPATFGFLLGLEEAQLLAANREEPFLKQLRAQARTLFLTWSDKAAFLAHVQHAALGALSGFDEGDARMSLAAYQRLVNEDRNLESILLDADLFARGQTAKLYRELVDTNAISQFCRDAGIGLKLSTRPVSDLDDFPAVPKEVEHAAQLIVRAAESRISVQSEKSASLSPEARIGEALEQAGRFDEARRTYEKALANSDDRAARLGAARLAEAAGDLTATEALLRSGLARDPDSTMLRELYAFFRRIEQPARALAAARLMRRRGLAGAVAAATRAAFLAGRYDLVRAAARSKASTQPELKELIEIAQAELKLDTLREASDDADSSLELGEVLRRLGRLDEALPAYRKAAPLSKPALARVGAPEIAPQFLLVGPPRTGTTLLRLLLSQHPQIAMPAGEPAFFSNDQRAGLARYLETLHRAKADKASAHIVGEKSPQYFAMPESLVAISAALFPEMKIVVTVREPVDRAWSEIKLLGPQRISSAAAATALNSSRPPAWLSRVLDNSRYRKHLRDWRQYFRPEQILIVAADRLETDTASELRRILAFLGVNTDVPGSAEQTQRSWSNRTPRHQPPPCLHEFLRAALSEEPWKPEELAAASKAAKKGQTAST